MIPDSSNSQMTRASLPAEWEGKYILWRSPNAVLTRGSLFAPLSPAQSHCSNTSIGAFKKNNNNNNNNFLKDQLSSYQFRGLKMILKGPGSTWCELAKLMREVRREAQMVHSERKSKVFLLPVMINNISFWFTWLKICRAFGAHFGDLQRRRTMRPNCGI